MKINSQGPKTGAHCVIRGGSWYSNVRSLHSAYHSYYNLGFRLLRTPNTLQGRTETALATARKALKEIEELLK